MLVLFSYIIEQPVLPCSESDREGQAVSEPVLVFAPENIAPAIREMESLFKAKEPGHTVDVRSASDKEHIYDIAQLQKKPAVLILSDEQLIEKFLGNYINWYVKFAYDKIVLGYTPKSRAAGLINEKNWQEILGRQNIRLGRMDEKISTLGYRTLIFLGLAKDYYQSDFEKIGNNFSADNIFSSEKELHFLLLANDIDYIFDYLSSVLQYKLSYITFPPEIDFGSQEFKEKYRQAGITIGDRTLNGNLIEYIITVPECAEHHKGGMKFLKVFFSAEGRAILKKYNLSVNLPSFINLKGSRQELEEIETILR